MCSVFSDQLSIESYLKGWLHDVGTDTEHLRLVLPMTDGKSLFYIYAIWGNIWELCKAVSGTRIYLKNNFQVNSFRSFTLKYPYTIYTEITMDCTLGCPLSLKCDLQERLLDPHFLPFLSSYVRHPTFRFK